MHELKLLLATFWTGVNGMLGVSESPIHCVRIVQCCWCSLIKSLCWAIRKHNACGELKLDCLRSGWASFCLFLCVADAQIGHQSSTSATSTCADTNPQPAPVLLLWCTCKAPLIYGSSLSCSLSCFVFLNPDDPSVSAVVFFVSLFVCLFWGFFFLLECASGVVGGSERMMSFRSKITFRRKTKGKRVRSLFNHLVLVRILSYFHVIFLGLAGFTEPFKLLVSFEDCLVSVPSVMLVLFTPLCWVLLFGFSFWL